MTGVSIDRIRVRRFKGIEDANFELGSINCFVGANNAGKSTLVQALHFSVGLIQAMNLLDKWGNKQTISSSLSRAELLYTPCEDLHALGFGGTLLEDEARAISVQITLNDGQLIDVTTKKGRNGNIQVIVSNVAAAKTISSLEQPFTIYSPGLSGIAKNETYMSDGVLLRTIARGDANLVFRNVLLRLNAKNEDWDNFLIDLQSLFPKMDLIVSFNNNTDEFIGVNIVNDNREVPVELAGTGILQAVQILSYVHYFHPSLIILDEPDSHLHPNNQRLLCELLKSVSEERHTQVVLTTHSRHVVDTLRGQAKFVWVRAGTAEIVRDDYSLPIFLDIGALDVKEMVAEDGSKINIFLTEDTNCRGLKHLALVSGFQEEKSLFLSYHGCTSLKNLRPLLEVIKGSKPDANVVVHRDSDYMSEDEREEWRVKIRTLQCNPFLTAGVDIESHYFTAECISRSNPDLSLKQAIELIEAVDIELKQQYISSYVNGRIDFIRKNKGGARIDMGAIAVEANAMIDSELERFRHGKSAVKKARQIYRETTGNNLALTPQEISPDDVLAGYVRD
ncbi:AAA family ATPase [Arenicella xantha]|uniref:AAA15 family ATPase/GTPase n=1 Tax=Arenicella xantha TaxID=644221 RepID=A0A395JN75_9GAMM|nr:AAA family ATPase [Arenicella xantha]RBP53124.1 AAA15 family ATPase/GTPase [Arenicella xantha]